MEFEGDHESVEGLIKAIEIKAEETECKERKLTPLDIKLTPPEGKEFAWKNIEKFPSPTYMEIETFKEGSMWEEATWHDVRASEYSLLNETGIIPDWSRPDFEIQYEGLALVIRSKREPIKHDYRLCYRHECKLCEDEPGLVMDSYPPGVPYVGRDGVIDEKVIIGMSSSPGIDALLKPFTDKLPARADVYEGNKNSSEKTNNEGARNIFNTETSHVIKDLHKLLSRIKLTTLGINPKDDEGYIFTRKVYLLDDIELALINIHKLESSAKEPLNSIEIFVSPDGGERTDGSA